MAHTKSNDEILHKLDLVVRLLSYQLVSGKTMIQGAPILRRLGLTPTEIATIFNTSPNSVTVRLAESKRPKKTKSKNDGKS